jgi:hypothetical protein
VNISINEEIARDDEDRRNIRPTEAMIESRNNDLRDEKQGRKRLDDFLAHFFFGGRKPAFNQAWVPL